MPGQWNQTKAGQRYTWRFLPTMVAYSLLIFGTRWVESRYHPEGIALVMLALLPALALVASIVVIGLYFVEETDEYLRYRLAFASLIGTGFSLSIMTVWGFLDESGQVPHMAGYWAYILWCIGMGLGQSVASLREMRRGGGE